MLIYKLLGDDAQQSFARSWGISYGVGAAAEWKDIATEAAKGVLLLAILETLMLTRPVAWLEARPAACSLATGSMQHRGVFRSTHYVACMRLRTTSHASWRIRACFRASRQPQEHVDYLSLQALLFERNTGLNLYQQTRLLYAFQRRVADG
jgi:hypothetical protein